MELYKTGNPVPSSAMPDVWDNSRVHDKLLNGDELEVELRIGKKALSWKGIVKQNADDRENNKLAFNQSIEHFKTDMDAAIRSAGYILLDSFQQGVKLPNNQITLRNQALRDERTGEYFRWNGALPKPVFSGATPESTGGIAQGAWVSVGDLGLSTALKTSSGEMIGYKNKGNYAVLQTIKDKLDRIYYVSDYGVLPGNTPAVNTTNLQNMLNELSGKSTITGIIFADQGTTYVNGPITIPNNTDIEIKAGVTVSGAPGNVKPVFISEKWAYVLSKRTVSAGFASNTADIAIRSDYIGLWGAGTVDYNFSTGGAANGFEMHCICMASISRLKLGGGLQIKSAIKYSYLAANILFLDAQSLRFNNNSDGLHLQPPIDYAYVRNLYGTTGDDMFALTGGDYLAYDIGLRGAFNHIDVAGIFGINSLCAVKVAGNSNTPVRHLSVDGIYGTYQHSQIRIWTDGPNLASTSVKTLNLDNIGGIPGAGYRSIEFKTVGTGTVTVDNAVIGEISANYSSSAVPVISATTGSAGNSAVRVYSLECKCPRDIAYFLEIGGDGAGADNTRIDSLSVTFEKTRLNPAVADACGVRVTRGQINKLTLAGSIDMASGQAAIRKGSGKIDQVIFDKLTQLNGYPIINTGVNWDGSIPIVQFIGGFYNNPDKLVSMVSGYTVIGSGPVVSAKTGELFTTTRGAVNISGHIQYENSCIPTEQVEGTTWVVKGFGIFADVKSATALRGNHCFNTNPALAGGIGPVVASGESWKSLA